MTSNYGLFVNFSILCVFNVFAVNQSWSGIRSVVRNCLASRLRHTALGGVCSKAQKISNGLRGLKKAGPTDRLIKG